MVVFTCNHCGESLQKPKVEKHYNFVCRKVKNLTCVDCFKDFKGEEYAVHTKCITEEERYAAKGTYANGIVKKGDVKQEAWVAHIRGIIEKEIGLKKPLKDLLITVSKHNNIPRKKRKFINYLTNSLGGRVNMKDIEAVWDIIEKHKDQENTTEDATKTVESNNSVVSTDNGKNESIMSEQEQDSQEPPTKKKKKKKQNEELITDEQKHIENGNNENVITENGNNESVINEENKQDSQEPPTKGKKKKKQNEELITEEQKHIENGNNESVITENGNNKNVISEENKHELMIKKKKRKADMNVSSNETDIPEVKMLKTDNGEANSNSETTNEEVIKVNMKGIILSILEKKGTISLKKLEKKVLSAYKKAKDESNDSETVVKKIHKKLKRLPVQIKEDQVCLVVE